MSLWRTILLAIKLVGARFGGAGIALASQVVLAHLLPQADVGIVFLGMSAAAFLSLFITVGYPQLAITNLPRYYTLGRESLLDAYHNAFWRDSLWMTLGTFLVVTAIYLWAPFDDGIKTALLFGSLSAVPSAFIRMNSAIANSLRRYTLSYVPDFLYRPGLLLIFLIAAWLLKLPVTVNQVLFVFVACQYTGGTRPGRAARTRRCGSGFVASGSPQACTLSAQQGIGAHCCGNGRLRIF